MSTISAKYTLKDNMIALTAAPISPTPFIVPITYPTGYENPAYQDACWEAYVSATTNNALLPFTFGSTVSNPIQGEIRFLMGTASYDAFTGISTPARMEMSFWDGTQWLGVGGSGGSSPGVSDDTSILLSGGNPTFANSYSIIRNPDNTINYETWTDSATSRLRRRIDYTYASGKVNTVRCRVYSASDGTTVVGDMTETYIYSYSTGLLVSINTTRGV